MKAKPRPKRVVIDEIRVDLANNMPAPECIGPRISTNGGAGAYIWVGSETRCLGYLDDSRKIRALRDLCNEVLRSRGAKP